MSASPVSLAVPALQRRVVGLLPPYGWLLAAVTGFQVVVAALMPVLPEEAYHWNFGRHLDIGYYDHPPMLPWSIALGRALLGDTPLGVRLVPLLFALGTGVLLARMARRIYGDKAALWVVFLHGLNPAAATVASWGFPDSPLLFFWMLTLTCVWRALEDNRPGWWLAAGAALGAGMLSKYTAAFLVPSVLLYLLTCPRDRRWLLTPWPYLAGVCSLIVFAPVIYWNWTHEWVSFRMQSTGRFEAASGLDLRQGVQSVAEQWLCVLPLTLPLAVVAVRRLLRSPLPADRFLLCAFAPMAIFFILIGWTPSWHLLWSLPAYLTLTVAMAGAVAHLPGRLTDLYRRCWPGQAVTAVCVLLVTLLHATCVLPGVKPLREVYGWKEAAAFCRSVRADLPPGSFYLSAGGRAYPTTSQLAFHLGTPGEVYGPNLIGWEALQYRFWANPQELAGKDAVVIVDGGDMNRNVRANLQEFFASVELVEDLSIPVGHFAVGPERTQQFTVYRAHQYRPAHGLK
jgi:dolichol-phosphate mannosyltransferase